MRRWKQSVEDQAPGQVALYSSITSAENETVDLGEEDAYVDKQDQVAVWNTLLELYLTLPGSGGRGTDASGKKFEEGVMRDKAMRVLRSDSIPYDSTHALILCSTHRFTQGLVLLWEKMGMYEDVLRFWMDQHKEGAASSSGASAKVIEHLMHYGSEHPHLYELVLRFLTSTPELLERHRDDVKGILEYIDEEGLMPPLRVIQVLSRNGVASVGLVKEWLVKKIKESRNEIQNVRFDSPKIALSFSFGRLTDIWPTGPRANEILSFGDSSEIEASAGAEQHGGTSCIPCYAMHDVSWPTGSSQCAFYVQPLLPPKVRFYCTLLRFSTI
jgi:hypothetical protein